MKLNDISDAVAEAALRPRSLAGGNDIFRAEVLEAILREANP